MKRYKHKPYIVELEPIFNIPSEDLDKYYKENSKMPMPICKRTINSAHRAAQRYADSTGLNVIYYSSSKRNCKNNWARKVYICSPIETNHFLEKI